MMGEARYVLTWLWLGLAVALALLAVVLVAATRRLVGVPVQQLSTALGYLAQGDLTHAVSVRSRDEIGSLALAMEGFRVRLVESLGTVRTSADSVSAASTEIAQGNQDLKPGQRAGGNGSQHGTTGGHHPPQRRQRQPGQPAGRGRKPGGSAGR